MKLIIVLFSAVFLCACSSTSAPIYNPHEFDTSNYQKNFANAIDSSDILVDFDAKNVPQVSLNAQDLSLLIQSDLYYNQGNYASAYPYYKLLSYKYKNPRIIYKAIICLEHISATNEEVNDLNNLTKLFIQTDPNSNLAKLFGIKLAINSNDATLAESNLDYLLKNNTTDARAILLFISSIISTDITPSGYVALNQFTQYTIDTYSQYPETHLAAILSYSLLNNASQLEQQINYIIKNYPNWTIPIYWSLDLLTRNQSTETLLTVIKPLLDNKPVDMVLQKIYIATLVNNNQAGVAKQYLLTQNQDNNVILDLAIIELKNGDKNQALNYLNMLDLNESDPLYAPVHLTSGLIYALNNNKESAIDEYEMSLSYPTNLIANIMLIKTYIQLHDYENANYYIEKEAKNESLTEAQTLMLKANFYMDEKDYQRSYQILNSKFDKYKTNANYLYLFAAVTSFNKYTNQAINLYKQYIKLDSNNAYGYNDLAYLYAEQTHDYLTALKYATKAYKIAPLDPNVLDTLGWVYYKLGNYNQALLYIRSGFDLQANPISARHLVAVYKALNKNDLASQVPQIDDEQINQQVMQDILDNMVKYLFQQHFGIELQ
jgi:tetratricopeptide (TPR) repeat protein